MRIGKQDARYQSISESDATSITVRGLDLCSEIIGKLDFTSYFWLLVTGAAPSDAQKAMADATLAAIAEHGLVPSVVAARMTLAAAPEAFQGAVSAGLLGCGSVVLGSAEAAGVMLAECAAATAGGTSEERDETARDAVKRCRADGRAIPGFGHPQHSGGDPRAHRLIELASDLGLSGIHIEMLHRVGGVLPDILGRALPMNVNGAIAAVMLDTGFPLGALKGISLLARTAGLIAHLAEEQDHPIGFILSGEAAAAIQHQPHYRSAV